MARRPELKQVDWVGSALDDLKVFPDPVQQSFGFQLYQLQIGETPGSAKPLRGKELAGVYELRDSFKGDAYRTVYIAKLKDIIYVLHCFKKKSKSGIATPRKEVDLIKNRLKLAIQDSEGTKR